MGRGKLKMELVKKEKARVAALKMRKEGLVKKIEQLTTLCDVPACMIIHDPSTKSSFLWPHDFSQVRRLIDSYKANPTAVRAFGVSDSFKGRQETKYDDRLDLMDESQLRELGQAVRSRIDFLKREAMVKKEKDVVLDLDEFEDVDQDGIFSAADDVMVKKGSDVVFDLDEIEEDIDQDDIFSAGEDVMVKEENDVFIDLDKIEEIDQDGIFSAAAADVMVKTGNDVMFDLDKIEEEIDRDDIFSAAAMVKEENDVFIDLDEIGDIDQADIFSAAMSANTQLPVPDYYCPAPLMDHNYLNYVNENMNWFGGDGGGDLAIYLWH